MKLKELFEDDDAVSPVIGVILMVAITVILAAVIGTFVLGLGEDVQQNAQAGVSFDQSGGTVDVQLTSLGNVKSANDVSIDVSSNDCGIDTNGDGNSDTQSNSFSSVGGIMNIVDCSGGDKITVTATVDGSSNVIATYEYNG